MIVCEVVVVETTITTTTTAATRNVRKEASTTTNVFVVARRGISLVSAEVQSNASSVDVVDTCKQTAETRSKKT